ncbi:MAG: hypothetical protein IT428_21115 [Planctomycetaceae bacterium]|nr:hypothetical protein [Planctomycetaceae bacterium]
MSLKIRGIDHARRLIGGMRSRVRNRPELVRRVQAADGILHAEHEGYFLCHAKR